MGGDDRFRGLSADFVPTRGAAAQKPGLLKAYCDCCVSRGPARDVSSCRSSMRVSEDKKRVSFLTALDPDELADESPRHGSRRGSRRNSAAYAAVRDMSKRISVVEHEIEVDEMVTSKVSNASVESFKMSIPGLDSSLAKVVRLAETMLPKKELSQWQLSWCTTANVKIYSDARAGDVQKAAEILALALVWREENKELLSRSIVPRWTGDARVFVRSQDGHPMIYWCFRHQIRFPHWKETIAHMVAVMEAAVEEMRGNATTFDCVADCHGFRLSSNFDPRGTIGLMQVMKHPYRARLRHGYLVDAPMAFDWTWNVAYPHLPPDTRDKIEFISSSEVVGRLAECVGPEVSQAVHDIMASNRTNDPATSWRQPSELID